jgi:hypothetical protein
VIKKNSGTLRLFLLVVAFAFLGTACEPVPHYNRLKAASFLKPDANPEAKPYGSVAVFQTANDVKQPYDLVGILSCEGSAAEEAPILNAMLYRAADMGGDGVLLGAPKNSGEAPANGPAEGEVQSGWATSTGRGKRRGYRSWVIKFKQGTAG